MVVPQVVSSSATNNSSEGRGRTKAVSGLVVEYGSETVRDQQSLWGQEWWVLGQSALVCSHRSRFNRGSRGQRMCCYRTAALSLGTITDSDKTGIVTVHGREPETTAARTLFGSEECRSIGLITFLY